MIKIENVHVDGWEQAIRGMRNPLNSWDKSDSYKTFIADENTIKEADYQFFVGDADYDLMLRLAKSGTEHAKYRRMIVVYADIIAPMYWYKEFETYKVGTVSNSCSTMHTIHKKEFTIDDFSHEHLTEFFLKNSLKMTIERLNQARELFLETNDKDWWWQMIQLLPSSYNQRRTVMLNYEVLSAMYRQRKDHKLDEWQEFCKWIKTLPYQELVTLEE